MNSTRRCIALNRRCFVAALLCVPCTTAALADEQPAPPQLVKHRITGLFSPDREQDLRKVFEKLPAIKLVKIDFESSEASFDYDSAQVFPGAKPEQIVERFDNELRNASNHTFGVMAPCTLPKDKLTLVEIPVVGLDCKACCLGAYEAIYRLKGVERATASFKEGRVTALIDGDKISRAELEMALRQRGVQLRPVE